MDDAKLVNWTRREYLALEAGSAASALSAADRDALASAYLRSHPGDWIAHVDAASPWPFPAGTADELRDYADVTDVAVAALFHGADVPDSQPAYVADKHSTHVSLRRLQHAGPDAVPREDLVPLGAFMRRTHTEVTYCVFHKIPMGIRLETNDYGATWRLILDQPWRRRPLFSLTSYDPGDEPPPEYWPHRQQLIARYPNFRETTRTIDVERPGQSWWTAILPAAAAQPLISQIEALSIPLFAEIDGRSEVSCSLTLNHKHIEHRLWWIWFDLPEPWAGLAPIIRALKDLVYAQLPLMGVDPES